MNRQTARSWRGSKHRAPRHGAVHDQERSDERVPLVRWRRISIGLGLIVIAIIWLAVDNALGLYATTPTATVVAPAVGTLQSTGTYTFNAKLVGSFQKVAGRQAPAGQRFPVMAVQVINRGGRPLTVQPRDFTLSGKTFTVIGAAYPGQKAPLFTMPVAPSTTAEGYLLFPAVASSAPPTLTYRPAHARGLHALSWRFP